MTPMVTALLAIAFWCWPSRNWLLQRVRDRSVADRAPRRRDAGSRGPGAGADDPFAVAATFDLLAVCLRAGLPVAVATRVAAESSPPGLAAPLTGAAELLELGADPQQAWATTSDSPADRRRLRKSGRGPTSFDDLATLARRSARAGSALSAGVAELADGIRQQAHDDALARSERAGVMVSGPLGLCFLPAFICLGIVPVVIGLASQTLSGW